MRCFSIILGARNTPSAGRRFLKKDELTLREITARHFPNGFTILNADGGWFDPERRLFIEEEARQILVCAPKPSALKSWCAALAGAFHQKELLVVELGPARSFRVKRPDPLSSRRKRPG